MSSEFAIKVSELVKNYRIYARPIDRVREMFSIRRRRYHSDFAALADLSFSVERGETVGIIGPNGSGKSTLMHILGFLDTLTKGQYKFRGKDVSNLNDDELAALRNKSIGFVFQNFNLLPKTTVWDNVRLPLLYAEGKVDLGIVDQVIESVGLTHRKDYMSNQLSGGEKQRVAIARAIIARPRLLLADEPTGNVDDRIAMRLMHLLSELNKIGTTVVVATHSQSLVSAFAHPRLHLVNGELEILRPGAGVTQAPANVPDLPAEPHGMGHPP